ncbi:Si-specific NAD(P)(+) transhydrogenase [Stratiformator vulcanicus]|uniref:Soluble pyridine nucleotide transhydrogenase n=1 Tax=Stratiformator vulcanicus TaxID=2527980 RepID=A0A517R5R0_9PLAN|nr:Si-specific NAD(P)(+) transhydrogenase [Stratiformator vulcanicus]QDT39199.1 Soluble pyridine nucleotide transhydrogenase [Stratiformator vulcanicus]
MEIDHRYDVIVIGTGPGGEGAAMQAVKEGKDVAVVERYMRIGGGCTHWGTIPSKALRYAIFKLTEFNKNPLFRNVTGGLHITFPELRKGASSVIDQQVAMRRGFYDRNGVDVLSGHGRFLDTNTIEVLEENGIRKVCAADAFVIATGSRPFRHPEVDFNHPRVYDSDTILGLNSTPRSITIFGAGVIGCEYASMFRNLGCKVNLVNGRDKLLEFLDDEIIDALSYHLRDRGVIIRHRESLDHVEPLDDGVITHLKSGKKLKTDVLLWAAGRQGNTEDLGLENIDIEPNRRGQIEINEHMQTKHEHIYAVGDVIGVPSLASAAYVQGRFAMNHLISHEPDLSLLKDIPTGIYTSPEISSLGRTERELTEAGIPYEVGQSMFKSLARAQITNTTVGMLKILFHRDTLELLGIHCFGQNASEIIHIGQAIMSQEGSANSLEYFMNTTFNYPTMAEAYRVAALNGYNRLF